MAKRMPIEIGGLQRDIEIIHPATGAAVKFLHIDSRSSRHRNSDKRFIHKVGDYCNQFDNNVIQLISRNIFSYRSTHRNDDSQRAL